MIQILVLSLLFIISPLVSASAVGVERGDLAPDFTLGSVDEKMFSLSENREKVVVMMYWREDQKRSIKALEEMNALHDKYSDKGVTMVGVIADNSNMEKVKGVIQEKSLLIPALIDIDRRVYGEYGVRVYPTTIIIDREGMVSHTIPGLAVTFKTRLEGYLRHTLGEIDDDQLQDTLSPKTRTITGGENLAAERKYNLALQFTRSRLIEQAIASALGSIEAKPDMIKAHILLGFLYLEEQEAEKAEGAFKKALELEPGNHDAQTGLGGVMIAQGEIDGAIDILKEAVEINPQPQMAYYELGRAYELMGEKDRAIEMYKMSMEKIIKKNILPSSISSCE